MKRSTRSARSTVVSISVVLLVWAAANASSAAEREATITRTVNDVKMRQPETATRAGSINDRVPNGSTIQTGKDSRVELSFANNALSRLSANTISTFKEGARELELSDGALLLSVPKGAGESKITAAGITAAVNGSTVILEYHPHAYLKLISLEGTSRLYLKRRLGESVLVRPGQIIITNPDGKNLADPVDVDVARLLKTSLLITDFGPLGRQQLIAKEGEKQQNAKAKRKVIDTNLVIFGKGTVVSLANPAQMTTDPTVSSAPQTAASKPIPASTDVGTVEAIPSPQPSRGAPIEDDSTTENPR